MTTRKRAISWLLMVPFLWLMLFPFHYHLDHGDDSAQVGITAQGHVIDPHFYAGIETAGDHDASHTIDPSSDIRLKSSGPHLPLLALLFVLSLLLPFYKREKHLQPISLDQQRPSLNFFNTPPLRAPPRP